ncbi:MAG TPA: hypothetical protein VG897_02725 [Terriglobales bacterium]|nr:hypothetical protein [Terriglobales bacterium]
MLPPSAIHPTVMTYFAKQEKDDDLKRHLDEELDEALEETFPASDPIEPPLESEHQKQEGRK